MSIPTIKNVRGREILSSGGDPTVEAVVTLSNGMVASASVPFGVSDGSHEAFILRDNDKRRYKGRGMLKAARIISTTLHSALKGVSIVNQKEIDRRMIMKDGTPNKTKLGGNALLAVSIACVRAGAQSSGLPIYKYLRRTYRLPQKKYVLPKPMMVTIEGGRHADRSTDFQEYLLTAVANKKRKELVRMTIECYQAVGDILRLKGYSTNVGNEGAFTPPLKSNEAPLAILVAGIKRAGYKPGKDVAISLDPAVTEVYKQGRYHVPLDRKIYTSKQMIGVFDAWLRKYPIVTLEDPLAEDDWDNWVIACKKFRNRVMVIGDDLTVTNAKRLKKAIDVKAITGILIKPNQIGTVSEMIETLNLAHRHSICTVISHRGGGETGDTFIVDLGVAVNASYFKIGPTRGERTEKYNRLLAIEDELTHG